MANSKYIFATQSAQLFIRILLGELIENCLYYSLYQLDVIFQV